MSATATMAGNVGEDKPKPRRNKGWDNLVPAKKGNRLNPHGRAGKRGVTKATVREIAQIDWQKPWKGKMTNGQKAVVELFRLAFHGESEQVRLNAINEILARIDPKPKEASEALRNGQLAALYAKALDAMPSQEQGIIDVQAGGQTEGQSPMLELKPNELND